MSANVGLSTPWAREAWAALGADRQAAIEAAVPEGHFLSLGAGRSRGDWTASLFRGELTGRERPVEVAVVRHRPTFESACWHAIYAGKVTA